ncbi:hypothetical protein DYI25_14390 [Mesobacillus boroniphilus]|uniref:Uncharacterized protein n=1 Tax=Mesobacillus boroniphilus TaxID=308892 RepID=A0A944GXD9_9BACI|nr:hypothetical protein [Mesobacillus boroniphilus]
MPLLVLTAAFFYFFYLKPDIVPISSDSKEKADVPTSLEFDVRGVHVRLLNSDDLEMEKLKGLQMELEREIVEILEFANGDMPVVDVLTFNVTAKDGYEYMSSALYFDPELEAEEHFFYYNITSNLFEQSAYRGRFTATGLAAYFIDGPEYIHEMYSDYIDVEVASIEGLFNDSTFVDHIYYGWDSTSYTEEDVEVADATWMKIGSFTSYLIDQYGSSLYFEIYDSSDISLDFKKVYGKTITEMENEWKEYLSVKYPDYY